jgi:GGDEF domain-containing protein
LAKAEHFEQAIAQSKRLTERDEIVSASAGVAMLARGDSAVDFLARADAAMYARKAARKRAR